MLLTGAGLIVKLLGAAYRIPLARLIGAEGMGLYQMAYPVYLIFLSLSTAGIPIAISKMVAEQAAQKNLSGMKQIFKAAFILLTLLGITGALAMLLSSSWLASRIVADSRAVFAMWALAPAIFFMSLMSVFRGYFQGQQQMGPSACSQVVEQIVRVAVSLILASLLLKSGVEHASAGAAFGATAGGGAGLLFLIIIAFKKKVINLKLSPLKPPPEKLLPVIKKLLRFTLPIAAAVIIMPLLQALDSIIVPSKLQSIGYSVKNATSMLGILGNGWAVLYLPMIVTGAIATNMVPAIAASRKPIVKPELQAKIQQGIRLATIYLIPVAVLLFLHGETVYHIIYGVKGIEIINWLAPAVFFLGIEQVTAGVLQGLNKPQRPLVNFIMGAMVKVMVTLVATGLPGLNLAGAAIGTVCGSGLTATLNLLSIKRLIPVKLDFMGASLLAGIFMLAGSCYFRRFLHFSGLFEFFGLGLASAIFYFLILWIMGGIRINDLEVINQVMMDKN
ncbi:MAG: polysaccharide biosynthesis protein [Firmicutes bacterium]|nr:polysaccharide biosynthesis protein [Bacillota bacterium]